MNWSQIKWAGAEWHDWSTVPFESIRYKTIIRIESDNESYIRMQTADSEFYRMIYHRDCCATCSIEDICGDLQDLVGAPLLVAELSENHEESHYDSETWAYYKMDTIKGGVTIRWYGSSNGYYCETAYFEKYTPTREK